jgi:DNA gyrase subunit A
MFTTKLGFVKLVSGIEFETNRSVVATTKLDAGDVLVSILLLTGHMVSSTESKVILLTNDSLSLGFPLSEVSELKKTSRGVKGIALDKNDYVVHATVVTPEVEFFEFNQKQLSAKKVRNRKRGAKGKKATL